VFELSSAGERDCFLAEDRVVEGIYESRARAAHTKASGTLALEA
jgi:hypothetical protein